MRAVAYIRVSTEEQVENWSLEAQQREFYELCASKGWEPGMVYAEEGKSAWNESTVKREAFRSLLQDAQDRKFQIVVVHSLDRWSRNLRVTLESFKTLSDQGIAFVSIREQIDYTTPEGKLFLAMLGAFAQYFSDVLAMHTKKGMKVRASHGLHVGGIPFGYEVCSKECNNHEDSGLHIVEKEAEAIRELFGKYASGNWALSRLSEWLNAQGFRTRSMRPLPGKESTAESSSRPFTLYSIRDILHNRFYIGKVSHKYQEYDGLHQTFIDTILFDTVQAQLRKARSREHTAGPAYRPYLLKGLARCIHCGLPLWADTPTSGYAYYREKRNGSTSHNCPANGKSVKAEHVDEQINLLVSQMALRSDWRDYVLNKVHSNSEREQILSERERCEVKLQRLKQLYLLGDLDEPDYLSQRRVLLETLQSLVIPDMDATDVAAELLGNIGKLWECASLPERHALMKSMVNSVFVDVAFSKSAVGIVPKPAFYSLFEALEDRPEAGMCLANPETVLKQIERPVEFDEPDKIWVWWRRGGVEPPVQRAVCCVSYRRSRCFIEQLPSAADSVR